MHANALRLLSLKQVLIPIFAVFCLLPVVSSGMALFLGIASALLIGNPYLVRTQKLAPLLMQASIIGLGAGMNLEMVARVGSQGIIYTVMGIFSTMVVGGIIGRMFRINPTVSFLVSGGTAICGGSAIAALSATLRAQPAETSVSLAVVFSLNAIALLIFPPLGHYFELTGMQFGFWSGMAIHDTSSVVGAALSFGQNSVETATTVKLARALWIVPLAFAVGWYTSDSSPASAHPTNRKKAARPWFILWFIIVAAVVTWIPALAIPGQFVYGIAQRTLVLTLFLIGANLSRASLAQIGWPPLIQGILLWGIVAAGTLVAIRYGLVV